MSIPVVYALLLISCDAGKYYANCYPEITTFPTKDACEAARIIPEQEGFLGIGKSPPRENRKSVCFPIPSGATE